MRIEQITNITEDQGPAYSKMLDDSKTLDELKSNLSLWAGLCNDAIGIVANWSEKDFKEFKRCLAIERSGKYSGDSNARRFAVVTMPEMMFRASILSLEYKVPWGLAVNRLATVTL